MTALGNPSSIPYVVKPCPSNRDNPSRVQNQRYPRESPTIRLTTLFASPSAVVKTLAGRRSPRAGVANEIRASREMAAERRATGEIVIASQSTGDSRESALGHSVPVPEPV